MHYITMINLRERPASQSDIYCRAYLLPTFKNPVVIPRYLRSDATPAPSVLDPKETRLSLMKSCIKIIIIRVDIVLVETYDDG